ncbi:MAG: DNA internalization-related competence protein ComEC/Rec2 [bacterium]
MPLIAWSVLVYAAALIVALGAGTAGQLLLAAAALTLAAAFALSGRRGPAAVAAVGATAGLVAISATRADARCAGALASAHQWTIDVESPLAAGDVAHVTVQRGACALRATLLVTRGVAAAGDRATVTGRASTGERGLFIQDAELSVQARAGLLARARANAGGRIDRLFTSDAPMVRALVIADMSGLPADQRDRYARAGLVHMLSVSGLHVGIIALALDLVASILRLPRRPARIATLMLLAMYVAAIGAPPSAVRAAVMLGLLLVSRLLQRPTSPWAILAAGALVPLADPRIALHLGWQLSVAGTAALIAGAALARRLVPTAWKGWRRTLATAATISVVATAVTAPLVAWTFGRLSLAGPVTNLLADPVMGLLQPLLFVAIAVPVSGVERLAADASHGLLWLFDAIARAAASVPGAAPAVLPSTVVSVAGTVASVALIVACLSRRPMRAVLLWATALAVIVAEPLVPHGSGVAELHMIDVGQGDAFALRTARGRWIVIDAGRSWPGGDAGRSVVAPYIARRSGAVALFVLSHPHADHVGGAASLFALQRPDRFLDPGYVGTSAPYRAALDEARRDRIPWQRVRPGDSLVVDDVVLTALAPDSAWAVRLADANLASTVLLVRIGATRVLFTGDAEVPEEDWLLAHDRDALRADVLKVGHHGSSTSTSPAFLAAVQPRVALVSVGAHNAYGHPSADVMAALHDEGAATLRTDQLGTVVLRFPPHAIEVMARGERWLIPIPVIR